MPSTMKAPVVHEFRKPLVIEDVSVPQPVPGQVVVKIAATGVCHADLHAAEGDWPVKPKPPFIPGHEGVGHVSAIGTGARATSADASCSILARRAWSVPTQRFKPC